ncbi:MAG: hypothetical protein ABJA98_33210 [Acidobacteriota bacterium]
MQRVVLSAGVALVTAVVICWPRALLSHETVTTTVLFDREIVRILNSHCVMCHIDGGPSFPLATYEEVWLQKRKISAAVLARHMPPWPAFSGYGRFANANTITLRESQFIVSWMEGLGPRNGGAVFTNTSDPSTPKPQTVRASADLTAWPLGEPTLSRTLQPITIAPKQPNDIKRVVVDLGLATERRVSAIEYKPGDRRVVRAAFLTIQETGQWVGSWTPWYGFTKLPAGAAFKLAAGTHIAVEVHYQHVNQTVVERGAVGLIFADADSPSSQAPTDIVLEARGDVPAGATAKRFRAQMVLASDTALLAMRPEVVPGVTSVEVSARRPDGGTDVLLFEKDIPLDWPTPFVFADPVIVRRGTTLSTTAYYANAGTALAPGGVRLTVSGYSPVLAKAKPK